MMIQPATHLNFIGGRWVEPLTGQYRDDRNPADTDDLIGRVPSSTREDVERAVAAAREAYPAWRDLIPLRRGGILAKAAALVRDRLEELSTLFTREEGKPIKEARAEVARAADIFEYFAGETARIAGETLPSARSGVFLYTVREPLGVVGVITPWNFPIAIPAWKIAPALACGNTLVFKPASQTAVLALRLAEILADAGLPAGVLNVVVGSGGGPGEALVRHEGVAGLSFTGSTEVGLRVYETGAGRGAKVQCEMGGKNPLVVLGDADLDAAIPLILESAFSGTGQKCTAASRLIVEERIRDRLVELLIARTRALRAGNGLDPEVFVGPLVDEGQLQRVLSYVARGIREGAALACGGERLAGPGYDRGFFLSPAVFTDVRPEMTIAREEIFGPVLTVMTASDFEEALHLANGSAYGLCAGIVTRDLSKALQFVRRVEAGLVVVNLPTVGVEFQAPFGGTKASGTGFKEQGRAAVEFYTHTKTAGIHYT